jgi:hypothetical protein
LGGRVVRTGGRRLPVLLSALHAAAQYVDPEPGPKRGLRFERVVAEMLMGRGFPVRAVAGGVEIFGTLPLSGLRHQFDAEVSCRDADVIGEWKAYSSPVPKNEVLLFKAKTDDIYEGMRTRRGARPVYRVFGMAGEASSEVRAYAARYGIVLVEKGLWPAPVLTDPLLRWPRGAALSDGEVRRLRYLCRPLQAVYRPMPDGSLRMPAPLAPVTAEALLATQRRCRRRLNTGPPAPV